MAVDQEVGRRCMSSTPRVKMAIAVATIVVALPRTQVRDRPPLARDAAESDVARRRVDRLSLARGRAVTKAVIGRAQM